MPNPLDFEIEVHDATPDELAELEEYETLSGDAEDELIIPAGEPEEGEPQAVDE